MSSSTSINDFRLLVATDPLLEKLDKELVQSCIKAVCADLSIERYSVQEFDLAAFTKENSEKNYIPSQLKSYFQIYKTCLETDLVIVFSKFTGSSIRKSPLIYVVICTLESCRKPYIIIKLGEETT